MGAIALVLLAVDPAAAANEIISTVAGTGIAGDTGDGGPAVNARINQPRSVFPTPDGGFLFAEPYSHRVRRVAANGTITTVAGNGGQGFSGDGGPATQAQLNFVHSAAPTPDGGFLLADTLNSRIRKVSAQGIITTVAGTGAEWYNGDGLPATQAAIGRPRGVVSTPDGGFLIPDAGNHRVRRVSPSGVITTVAGSGVQGFSGDGGQATSARLSIPFGVAPTPDGGFLVVDIGNQRIRRVSPTGIISTVAGNGIAGYGGDGGAATAARLHNPHNVVAAADGGFFAADSGNHRVRRVDSGGRISTFAGNGFQGFSGDGGAATAASLNNPKAVGLTGSGGVRVADEGNNRIRMVAAAPAPATTTTRPAITTTTTRPASTTTSTTRVTATTTAPTTSTTFRTTTTAAAAQNPTCTAIRQRLDQTSDPRTRQALQSLYQAYGCQS